jgi:hypothetical protein
MPARQRYGFVGGAVDLVSTGTVTVRSPMAVTLFTDSSLTQRS